MDSLLPRKLIPKNLIIAYKCNDNLVDPQNLIRKMFLGRATSKIFALEIFPLLNTTASIVFYNDHWMMVSIHHNR